MNRYPTRIRNNALIALAGATLMLFGPVAHAAGVPNTFSSGQVVSASQMNDNFTAVESDIANPSITGNITMPNANATGSVGVIMKGGFPFLHDYGVANTFVGQNAGNFTMTASAYSNTGVGNGTLGANTTGYNNTASGAGALFSNTAGFNNTASGSGALNKNTTGNYNTASGYQSLFYNTTGYNNTASGIWALSGNTTGNNNTANGTQALASNTTGNYNTASGTQALASNTTSSSNTASGYQALYYNTTGYSNTASGAFALFKNTTGSTNTANGYYALYGNTTSTFNTVSGYMALIQNTNGSNTAIGGYALYNATGSGNIAIGVSAGSNLTSGNGNIYIGNYGPEGPSNFSESYTMRIGTAQTSTYIAGIYGSTSASGIPVYINSSGQLGTVTSSRRYKNDITAMGNASDVLMQLRPVTFYYKADHAKHRTLQYGLVAEEVQKVAPQLVADDAKGQPYTVRYQFLAPMLLNEYQKQQHTIQTQAAQLKQQSAEIAEQRQHVAALEQQSRELVALREQVARMSAVLARLNRSENLASSNP
jgi:hypothetical protein